MFAIRKISRSVTALAVGALAMLAVGGLQAQATDEGLTQVTVSMTPSAAAAAFRLGIEKGFFKEEGLKVEFLTTGAGAVTGIPSLLSGEANFTSGSYDSAVIAVSRGLGIRAVAPTDVAPATAEGDMYRIVTVKGSAIRRPADLQGKTVGVNSLGGLPVFQINAAVSGDGGDPAKVKYVAVPFPQGMTALEQGRVDAIHTVEPFLTTFSQGASLDDVGPDSLPLGQNAPVVGYLTSTKFYEENRDIVVRFQRAMNKSNAHAAAHPDEARATVSTYMKLAPEVIAKMRMPTFIEKVSVEDVARQQDLIVKFDPDVGATPPPATDWVLPNPLDAN